MYCLGLDTGQTPKLTDDRSLFCWTYRHDPESTLPDAHEVLRLVGQLEEVGELATHLLVVLHDRFAVEVDPVKDSEVIDKPLLGK